MSNYELLYILPGTYSEEELVPHIDKIKDVITSAGGIDLELHDLGKNRLAYPIRHIRYGYCYLCRFVCEKDAVAGIQQKIGLMGDLLRSLIQQYDPNQKTKPEITHIAITAERPQSTRRAERSANERPKPVPTPTTVAATVAATASAAPIRKEEKKVSLEEIDKKLDEILDADIQV